MGLVLTSVPILCPMYNNRRENTRMMEKEKMKGLLRPYLLVQESDIFPSMGTVNNAKNGATPRIMDMYVSENPTYKELRLASASNNSNLQTFSKSGGIKVKATQAAISRPQTTALIATSLVRES